MDSGEAALPSPSTTDRNAVTRMLHRACGGDDTAHGDLFSLVYQDMRRMAAGLLRRERRDHTLQPTALVHEAWLRLVDETAFEGQQAAAARQQFLRHAVQAMRRILIRHARRRLRVKRGGGRPRVPFAESQVFQFDEATELLDLDAALAELAERKPRLVQIAELRIYGGLSVAEASDVVGVSLSTAKGEWALAKALLTQRVRGPQTGD